MTDIVLLAILTFLISVAIWKIRKNRKKEFSFSNCNGCPLAGDCKIMQTK